MKLITLFKLALIWASRDEIEKLRQLAAGTHHIHKNKVNKRKKTDGYAGPREGRALPDVIGGQQ